MRTLIFALMALLTLAPLAAAQDEPTKDETNDTRPDDAAWVEDCPPDMMCTASEEPTARGDCGGEVCAYGRSCESCRGEDAEAVSAQDEATNAVPAPGLALIVAGFGLAVVLVARKL